jgi:benzoyl-CoA reductase subunit B
MSHATTRSPPTARKDESQERQKRMIADHFHRLATAETGREVRLHVRARQPHRAAAGFDLLPVLPEINALQSGMRGKSRDYIALAEKLGHSEDVCTYVKCDVGMLRSGNVGPTGERLPNPTCCSSPTRAASRS